MRNTFSVRMEGDVTGVLVTALLVDDRPLTPPSMRAATLNRSGSEWAIDIRADWISDLCDRIRRSGIISNAAIRLSTSEEGLTGVGTIQFVGEMDEGTVDVLVTGVTPLTPWSASDVSGGM